MFGRRKQADDRYCSNCRALLPADAEACLECGVFAGDLYDERVHRPKTRWGPFAALLVLALVAGGASIWWNTVRSLPERSPAAGDVPSVRVVKDRPGGARQPRGAAVNEAEALRLVRRHIVETTGVRSDCIALLGGGFHSGAWVVTAHDSCNGIRLGKFVVKGREVSKLKIEN